MKSLKKLGVECSYDPNKPEELRYSISIEPDRLRNPEQARRHFTRIINAVSDDASKKGGLDHLTLSVDGKYQGNLQLVARELLSKAVKHKEIRKKGDTPTKVFMIAGGVAGGLAGLVFGYSQLAEWATNAAEYMNNASHLWAPIAGLTQVGISILGTATTIVGGAIIGAIGGEVVSSPCRYAKTPLARKVARYRSLEQALSQAETNQQETE